MPRNGSGTYVPPSNSWNPAVDDTDIDSADWNDTLNDLANALTGSLAADGQTPVTGDLQMGGYKIEGLASGTTSGDALAYQQIGAQIQAYNANLAAIAGQTTAADRVTYWTGSGAASLATFTAAGRALVDDADAAAQRTTLGLGTAATSAASAFMAAVVGMVTPYAGASAPSLWLLCYGQAISRTTYSALFSAIGTTYGTGDGSTTFNVPDLRGRAVAGQDDMGGTSANRLTGLTDGVDGDVLGAAGGLESTTLTTAQIPLHGHPFRTSAQGGGSSDSDGGLMVNANTQANQSAYTGTPSDTLGQQIGGAGGGGAHNNVQPTLILNYIIYAGV